MYFNPNSVWNKPISYNPVLMPNSQYMISQLLGKSVDLIGIGWNGSCPVYQGKVSDPIVTVRGLTFHLPDSAIPDIGSDGKLVVIDGDRCYSFYRFSRSGPSAEAGGSGDITATGDGISTQGWGGRATGWTYLAGLIMRREIQAGLVEHALAVSLPVHLVTSSYIWPARASDGAGGIIPMGVRIQLDPTLDLNSLGLSPEAKAIARALQIYGAWVADTNSGSISFYVQEFTDSNGNPDPGPWFGLLLDDDLSRLPISKCRVLAQADPWEFSLSEPIPIPIPTPPSITIIKARTTEWDKVVQAMIAKGGTYKVGYSPLIRALQKGGIRLFIHRYQKFPGD